MSLAFSEQLFNPTDFDIEAFSRRGIYLPRSLKNAVSKRQVEFLNGRLVAAQALAQLDIPYTEIPIGENRAPQWPEGVVGAITHTKGYAAALVGRAEEFSGVGVDAELISDKPRDRLIKYICREGELENLQRAHDFDLQTLFTLIFSAKESLYKALFPRVQKYFGFMAAEVLHFYDDNFDIILRDDLGPWVEGSIFSGRYDIDAAHQRVLTKIAVVTVGRDGI